MSDIRLQLPAWCAWSRFINKGLQNMSEIIEFPLPDRPFTESEIDKLHSQAFRDLEEKISDCVTMASIAVQMVVPAIEGCDDKHKKAVFAMCHLAEMMEKLEEHYHAAWHGELAAKQDRVWLSISWLACESFPRLCAECVQAGVAFEGRFSGYPPHGFSAVDRDGLGRDTGASAARARLIGR
jgi:hypothetical protein